MSFFSKFLSQRLFIANLLLSVFIVAAYFWAPDKTLTLGPSHGHTPYTADDRFQGGESIAELSYIDNTLRLQCLIKTTYQWPYCEAIFERPKEHGLDLRGYNFLHIKAQSIGKGPQNVKIYLRNHNARYATPTDRLTQKINEVQFDPNILGEDLLIPMSSFRVAPWWLNQMGRSSLDTTTDFDNITTIDISSGDFREAGEHIITVESIVFIGRWLNLTQMLAALLALWLSFSLYCVFNSNSRK